MKNILLIAALMVLVWGCAKKMTPATSETPSSNIGSSGSSSTNADPKTANSTPATNTPPAVTSSGVSAALTPAVGRNPEEAALIAGQNTYNAKCGRCHAYKVTTEFTADRWMSIMAVMSIKANLTETERANVTAYVRANSKK